MTKTQFLFAILVLFFVATTATAQMPMPDAKLKELQYFAGTWQCKGTAFASPWTKEHPTKGTAMLSWSLGNYWLDVSYRETKTEMNPMPYAVKAYWGYDAASKKIVAGSVDSMGGYATQDTPGWTGDSLVFDGVQHAGGMTSKARDTFMKKSATEVMHMFEMESDGKWMKLAEETCKKK